MLRVAQVLHVAVHHISVHHVFHVHIYLKRHPVDHVVVVNGQINGRLRDLHLLDLGAADHWTLRLLAAGPHSLLCELYSRSISLDYYLLSVPVLHLEQLVYHIDEELVVY